MGKNKLRVFLILFSIIYWVLVAFHFVTVRYSSLGEYAPPDLHYGELIGYTLVVGISIGVLFGLFPLNRVLQFRKRTSFLTVLLIGTGFYILFFTSVIFFTSLYGNTFQFALNYVFSGNGLILLFHLSIASLLYHFILQINKKFGPGILLEYASGRYFTPKVEERAFMFLDLKSSTSIAESLEHVAYSRLIQDCYAELSIPLIKYKGQVYQYVGDEVVVSWKINESFSASYCYDFFYAFLERLKAKKEYFINTYGVYPEFKAGVHCGKVTVAEVGEIKSEIAYHGDVLNTASRIQSLCNHFQQQLLVSESLLQYMPESDRMDMRFIDEVIIKGRVGNTRIFSTKIAKTV